MKIYDGGSFRDEQLSFGTENSVPFKFTVTSSRNQVFIMLSTNNNRVGKGFTAKITFGKYHIFNKTFPFNLRKNFILR